MRRWLALVGGVLVQLVIGGVYAWSLFGRALQPGLSAVQAAVPFEVAIGMIFVGASIGGRLQDRSSPRVVALVGVALYALGALVASLATTPSLLWLLVLGYGVIGGFGLGMAYIVPVALLQKWFPTQTAVVTGVAVGGFGFGALVTSPLAQPLIAQTQRPPSLPSAPSGSCTSWPGWRAPPCWPARRRLRRRGRLRMASRPPKRCGCRSGTCSPRS